MHRKLTNLSGGTQAINAEVTKIGVVAMKGFHPFVCIRVSLLYRTVEFILQVAPIVARIRL